MISLLLLTSIQAAQLETTCIRLPGSLVRCENSEVICYGPHHERLSVTPGYGNDAGVACKFKRKNNYTKRK